VILPTSQWSLEASAGAGVSRRRTISPPETPLARGRRAEEICRTLVASTTPDGAPVLRRALTPGERTRLVAHVADLIAVLRPCSRALARMTAVLHAPVTGELALPPGRAAAEAVFKRTLEPAADAAEPGTEAKR
jgi:hypothetical protein